MCSTEEREDESLLKKQVRKCFSLKYNIYFCLLNNMYILPSFIHLFAFDKLNWLGNQHTVENDEAEESGIRECCKPDSNLN